ncbi:unnamed protein product [Ophioblennius macclurei]
MISNLVSRALRSHCASALRGSWSRPPPAAAAVAARSLHVDNPPVVPTLTSSYIHGTSDTPLLHATVGELLTRMAEKQPDKEAVVFMEDGIRKTFAEFHRDVDQAAAGLMAIGMTKGDRLGMWGPNTYEWVLFQFATAKVGIILVAINPAYQVQEVEYALQKVGCKAIVCPLEFRTQKYCDMLRKICPEIEKAAPGDIRSPRLPDLRSVIVLGGSRQPGMFQMEDVMQAGTSRHTQQLQEIQKTLSFDDPINIQFTSGTTGAPKGATLTHHNIVNNAYFVGRRMGYCYRPDIRVCLPVPMYHCFGSVGGGMCLAVHGVTLVYPSAGYSGKANLEAIQKERCTFLYGTPTMFVDMLNQPDRDKFDLSSVTAGIIAGSPCPPELVKQIIEVMAIPEITIGYGTTENSPVTFAGSPFDNMDRKCNTVGFIMEHMEAKVVNPSTGLMVPVGEKGEIWIRGYCVMLEYWRDPKNTEQAIGKDRWYRTGDIGSLNSFGYLQIEGRIKDMIIRGGENVYPAEIEKFLHTHPKVREAQVVGVADPRMGEEVCACIQLVDGEECTAEEIKSFCKGEIAHFKIPRYVQFVTSFPLTVTGKIQKNKLSAIMEKQLGLKPQ